MKRIVLIVTIIAALSSFSFAQELGFHGVAAHAGLILPQEDGLETGFGFGAKVNMGEITQGLTLLPVLFYHIPGSESSALDFSVLIIGADVQYAVNNDVYVGGGLHYNNKSVEFEYTNPFTGQKSTTDDSEGDIGLAILAGYKLALGTLNAAIEARYGIVSDYNHLEIGLDVFFGGN
jgi:hypothetical protein